MLTESQATTTPTRIVRVNSDLAEMLGGIVEIEGGRIADILDPLIRPQITAMFERVKPTLDKIRRAKATHKQK